MRIGGSPGSRAKVSERRESEQSFDLNDEVEQDWSEMWTRIQTSTWGHTGVTQVGNKAWWSDMAASWLAACGATQNKPYLDNQSVGFAPSTMSIVHASCAGKRWTELVATRNTNSCTTYTERARSTRKCLSALLRRSPTLKVLLYQRTQHCASTCHTLQSKTEGQIRKDGEDLNDLCCSWTKWVRPYRWQLKH